jgi:DNA-binding transcriptional regulator YhcF (GntR family)
MSTVESPPYARIVAALREQIESGALAPGDRVPSTREITRQWGVAMATATKALTALRQAGLVKAVPGVGTVVDTREPRSAASPAAQPHRRPPSDTALTTERIVAVALTVADTEGIQAASMRRVAADLGVGTMSLYRHVADKDELLMRMMDTALREWSFPTEPPAGWRAKLELAARMLWRTFLAHPWLAAALSLTRPQPVSGGLVYTEWVAGALDQVGLDLATTFTTHITLFNYVRGTAINLELETEAEAVTGMDNEEWLNAQEAEMRRIISSGEFPMFERLATNEYDFDLDNLFEFGLQRLLDGLAVLINDVVGRA